MGLELPERTIWGERVLQGLTFWVGHRKALFDGYPLPEAALVAEACTLLQASMPKDLFLECEVMYRKLVPAGAQRVVLGDLDRVDLVITRTPLAELGEAEFPDHVDYIIEVKRSQAAKGLIERDIKRVYEALALSPGKFRGLLFVVSQSSIPKQFVTEDGVSKKGPHRLEGTDAWYVVRRTCKAASSFQQFDTAHFACLIEVFTNEPQPMHLPED